jgi:hypothetical protein
MLHQTLLNPLGDLRKQKAGGLKDETHLLVVPPWFALRYFVIILILTSHKPQFLITEGPILHIRFRILIEPLRLRLKGALT